MLHHEIIQDYASFLTIRDDWNALVDKADLKAKVFQDYDWLNIWYRNYRYPCSLYNVLLYNEDQLVAIAPLCLVPRKKFGITGNAVCFMGISMSDYCEVICDKSYTDKNEIYRQLFEILEKHRRDWAMVSLEEIPVESSLFRYVSTYKVHKFSGLGLCSDCSYVDTSVPWESYSSAIFPKGLRRKERNLREHGDLQFGQINNFSDVEPFMNMLFDTHIRRWESTDQPSRFLEECQRSYFVDMVKSLFSRNMIDLSYLSLNGVKVAFHFGFRDDDRLYVYLHTFNPTFQQYSVGRIFLYYLIRHSYTKYRYIDFLRGSESYKSHFRLVNTGNYRFGFYKTSAHMWIHSKLGDRAFIQQG